MKRIQFQSQMLLNQFFSEIKLNNSTKSWKTIASNINTTRSMIHNYRKGKLLLPEDRFFQLLSLLTKEKQEHFSKKILKKEANWGQKIGGLKAYNINKEAFQEGRKSGSKFRKNFGVKYDFNINMPLSEELCEFLGVIIGDGCTNKYGHMYQTQIAGDNILDKEYHNNLSQISRNLFGINPRMVSRPKGLYLNIYSKRVFELLTERFKIPKGVKCYTVKIPTEIFEAPEEMLNFVLRGMFNADGGVGVDRRKAYKKPYIRVNYTSISEGLIDQVHSILERYNISHSVHSQINPNGKIQQIQINGERNVKIFLKKIGFSNPRHLKKVSHLL